MTSSTFGIFLDAHEKLDALRHAGEFEARRIAALDIDRRLEAMNEFRAQITNEHGTFIFLYFTVACIFHGRRNL